MTFYCTENLISFLRICKSEVAYNLDQYEEKLVRLIPACEPYKVL